ncbi:hypothetical protein BK644_14245 [Pseudomonas protegens]|nr:hypothetical protein BK644_14245 [Pseudomonas protegens]
MFTRDTFEQRRQLIELSRECLNVMFRRNADTIQGTGDARVKSLLDLVQLHFDFAFKSADIPFNAIYLTVGCFKLFSDNFFAFLFNGLTSLDQLLEVLAAFLTNFGVGPQACQPDLAGIGFDFTQSSRLGINFFLQNYFGHGAPHAQKV